MRRFLFEDGSELVIADSATVITNRGPLQADQVIVGNYVRCGTTLFCLVDTIIPV